MQMLGRVLPGTGALVEREDSLAALHGAYSETKAGSGRLVFLAGEAGVGKTVLARAFCESVGRSTRVLEGACDPLATPREARRRRKCRSSACSPKIGSGRP